MDFFPTSISFFCTIQDQTGPHKTNQGNMGKIEEEKIDQGFTLQIKPSARPTVTMENQSWS